MELKKRGFELPGKKPRTVLDMMQCIETMFEKIPHRNRLGSITVYDVDLNNQDNLREWLSAHPVICTGAMGTRAKQCAENLRIHLDFTYGVIDKCILKTLLGEDTLILTTGSMVKRVFQRVDTYGLESGVCIPVHPFVSEPVNAEEKNGSAS
jgi:cobalt/nickel transport system ATP-binding protein